MMEQKQVTHQDLAVQALDRIAQHEKDCGERWAEAVVELRELRKATDSHAMRWEKLAWLVVASAVTAAVTIVTTVIVQKEYRMNLRDFFTGGTADSLAGGLLGFQQFDRLSDIGTEARTGAEALGARAQADTAFRPFTVSTGFGGVATTPEGGYTTTLSPEMAAQQQALQGITGGLMGGMGTPDVSGIQQQALGGVGGFLTGAMAPMAQREADVYERIRATQRPEEQRQQLALEECLAAQGRTGLRTAQFGGSPEQLALAQAQEEAKARASLGALQQAQAEQMQQAGLAQSMFGLGSGAAALPASLQQAQLGNIGAALGLQYSPEQQLLSALDPAVNLANIAGTGQRQGAGYLAQAGTTGLEALGQTEIARANLLRDLYSGLLAQQTSAETGERQESIAGGLFGDLISGIGSIFGGQ